MGTKAKLSTKVISIFLSALMVLSCAYVALPGLAPKAFAASPEEKAWQELHDAFESAFNGGYMSTGDWSAITSSGGTVTITDGTTNGYAYRIVAAIGELIELIGVNKHNSELIETITDTLRDDYNMTLNTYQTNFLNTVLDTSGIYGTYSPDNIWNGTSAAMASNLTAQTITITANREESAAILSDFESIDELAAAEYKISKAYTITITGSATAVPSTNGAETGAYYVNSAITAAPAAPVEAAAKTALQKIKAYLDYVNLAEFKTPFDTWYNDGNAANTASLYTLTTEQINTIQNSYGTVRAGVETGDPVYVEEYIGSSNYAAHQQFVTAAVYALTVVGYKDYVAWLVNGTPLGGSTRNRDDYELTDPDSIEKVIAQASANKEALDSASVQALAILKDMYPGFIPENDTAGAYNVEDPSTYTMNYRNYIWYLSSLLYNYYLQEIKAGATVLLNNGASTTYTFTNEASKFFSLLSSSVGSDYQQGTKYEKTSDSHIDQDKTYYTPVATYSYAATSDTEVDGDKHYFTNWTKVVTPVQGGLTGYYEDVEVFTYALTEDTELKANKTYYTLADGVYTAVETPSAEALSSYYERTGSYHEYQLTADTQVNALKTYYTQGAYTVVTSPSDAYIGTYAERTVQSYTYQLTADKVLMNGKTYYTSAGVEITEPSLENISSYYEIKFQAVASPTAPYLFDYYEQVGAYYGLKGVGNGEYVSMNYASGECPINDTDLSALYTFFSNAVTTITAARDAGVDIDNYMDAILVDEIDEMATALRQEQISRGHVTEAFLEDYQPAADLMAGYIKGGKSIPKLYEDLKTMEALRATLRSRYSWFSSDPRDTVMGNFIAELYNEIYDRVQAQYIEIQNEYKEYGNVNVRNYYQLKQNNNRLNDLKGTYNGSSVSILSFIGSSYAAGKISGTNDKGFARNSTNLSKVWYNGSTQKYEASNVNLSTIQSAIGSFNVSGAAGQVSGNQYSHDNITRQPMDADWVHNVNYTAYFTSKSTPASGNYNSVASTITKLDNFLKSEDFIKVLGADEQGKNITDLTLFIQDILAENIFTDAILDKLVGLLFPMLTGIFDETLPTLLATKLQGNSIENLTGGSAGGVDLSGGTLWFYFGGYTTAWSEDSDGNVTVTYTGGNPGSNLTNTFVDITSKKAGINIYPSTFGNYLATITTSAGVNNDQVTLLRAIGNSIKNTGNQSIAYTETHTRNSWDQFKNADGEFVFNGGNGFNWGVDAQTTFAGKYSQFKAMLGAVLGSCIGVLRTLFGDPTFTIDIDGNYNNGGQLLYGYVSNLSIKYGIPSTGNWMRVKNAEAKINIYGLELYKKVWIPLMEALGMNASDGGIFSWTVPSPTWSSTTGPELAGYLVDPIYELILAVSRNPVQCVCKLLPNLAYHLLNGSIDNLLDIVIKLNIQLIDFDVSDAGGGAAAYLVNWEWVKNLLLSALSSNLNFTLELALKDMFTLEGLLGFDLKDLNTVVAGILAMIKKDTTAVYEVQIGTDGDGNPIMEKRTNLPGIGTGKLATMFKSGGFHTNYSTSGARPNNVGRTWVAADPEYVFYSIFNWIFRAAQTKGGLADVLSLIGALSGSDLGDKLPEIVYALVEGIESADLAFAALVELLNEPEYAVSGYNWYKISGSNQPTINWSTTSFTYLEYTNKWTEDKAKYVYNNVDNIVNAVVNMITPETLADFDGDVNVWLDKTINSMFNNEGIMNVVELVTTVGNALSGANGIVKLLKQQLTSSVASDPAVNLYAWYNVFGYLYDDYRNIELETNQFLAYNAIAKQVYVYEAEAKDKDVSDFVASLKAGTQTQTSKNASDYLNYTWKIVQAYPVAPGESIPWTINGQVMSRSNIVPYNKNATNDAYQIYENLFSNLRWTEAEDPNGGEDPYYTWEVKLTSDIIGHLKDNGGTLKRIGTAGSYTGYKDEDQTYAIGAWYPLVDGANISDPTSENARAVFSAVFSELIGPFSTLFSFILYGKDLNLFGNNMTIQGYNGYNHAVIPFLEALGIYDLKTASQMDSYVSVNGTRAAFDYLVNKLFEGMDELLTDDRIKDENGKLKYFKVDSNGNFLDSNNQITTDKTQLVETTEAAGGAVYGKGAFQKLIDVLPHLFYFLQSDGLTTVIKNLPMFVWQLLDTLRPIANIDVDDIIHAALCRLLGYVYKAEDTAAHQYAHNSLTTALLDTLGIEEAKYSAAAATRDADKVSAIFGFSLKNMTLQSVYSLLSGITGLNIYPLTYALEGMCQISAPQQLSFSSSQNEEWRFTSYLVPNTTDTYKTYTLNFEGQDTITVTLDALLDILKYEGNAAALDELMGTVSTYLPGSQNLLTGEGLGGLIQAIVKILDNEPYGINVDRPNWDYIFENKRVIMANGNEVLWENIISTNEEKPTSASRWAALTAITNVNNYDFSRYHEYTLYNLQYLSSWTENTARATYDMLSSVLDYVVSIIDLSDQFEEGTDVSSFSAVVDALLSQKVFTPDLMIQLLDLLANVYEYLPDEILDVIDHLLTDNAGGGATVNMFAWRDNGLIVKDYPWKDDGTQDTTKPMVWQANREYGWFNAEATGANKTYTKSDGTTVNVSLIENEVTFIDAIGLLLDPAGTLFALIFLNEDYNLLKEMNRNSTAAGEDAVVLNGVAAYATAIIPLFEALGLDLTGYEPDKYDNHDGTYNGSLFVSDLVDLVDVLLKDIIYGPRADAANFDSARSGGPVMWIIQNLPNIIYFTNADGIKASINNVFGAINGVIDAIETVVQLPVDFHNLLDSGLDLTDVTMEGIFGMIYTLTKGYDDYGNVLPGLYMSPSLLSYIQSFYIGKIEAFTSANGYQSFRMVYSHDFGDDRDEEEHDLITILLATLLEYATDSGTFYDNVDSHGAEIEYNNADALDRLLFKGSDMEGIIGQVIYALRNPEALVVSDMDWNYFNHDVTLTDDTAADPITVPYYAFQYLNWTTEWTYEKASTAADEFETLIFQVLKMLVPEDESEIEEGSLIEKIKDADEIGDVLSIDFIFSADLLNSILDLMSGLLYGEESVLNEEMITLIGYLLGGDFSEWNGLKYSFETVEQNPDGTWTMPAGAQPETIADITGNTINYLANQTVEVPAVKDNNGNVITPATTKTVEKLYLVREGNQKDFIAGLTKVLVPAQGLLGWLLFGKDYTFFNPHDTNNEYLLTITGSNGYKDGLVLLLEALGCDTGLKYAEAYSGNDGSIQFIYDLANSIGNRALEICSDPVNEIVDLLPELIYFINAGGLAKTVTGLLSGPLGLVNQVSALGPVVANLLNLPATATSATDESSQYALIESTIDGILKGILADKGYSVTANPDGSTDIDFKLTGLNLAYVFNILEVITGMEITDVIGSRLDLFAIGQIHAYDSKSGSLGEPALAYKMGFNRASAQGLNDSFADFITILLSAVVDLLEYKDGTGDLSNVSALASLLKLDPSMEGVIKAVVALLKAEINSEILPIDWFYFSEEFSKYEYDEATGTISLKDPEPELTAGSLNDIPEPSINYLTYASDWTQQTSQYIVDHFEEIVDGVLGMFVKDEATGASKTLSDVINDSFSLENDVFTYENYSAVIGAVSGIAVQIPDVVNTLLNIALEMDLTSLGSLATLTESQYNALDATGKKNAFVSAIISIATPLRPIFEWLLFNQSLAYFDKDTDPATNDPTHADIEQLISISGFSSYNDALVPLLEAIGVDCPSYVIDETYTTAQRNVKFGNFLSILIEKILIRLEEILQDPADAVINLLPNLIYFVNTNALATIINNLVAPIIGLVNEALPTLFTLTSGIDLNDPNLDETDVLVLLKKALVENNITAESTLTMAQTISIVLGMFTTQPEEGEEPAENGIVDYILANINFTKLDLVAILELVEGLVAGGYIAGANADLKIVDVVGAEKIENFYLNGIEYFESASGKPAFRMPGSADMITVIINFLLEVVMYQNGAFSNAEEIDKLITAITGEQSSIVQQVVALVYGLGEITEPEIAKLNWNYWDDSVILGEVTVPNRQFVYLDYSNQWTFEKAVTVDGGLETLVEDILEMAGVEDVSELLDFNLADYLNAESLNTILGAINGLFGQLGDIPEALLNVLGLVLGINFSEWDGSYDFVASAPAGTTTVNDSAHSLKYYVTTENGESVKHYIINTTKRVGWQTVANYDDFSSGLALIIEPLQSVLAWLLLGKTYAFFVRSEDGNVDPLTGERLDNELIRVPGSNGYDTGLVLLLEALGCKNLGSISAYQDNCAGLVRMLINSVVNRFTEILNDPINEILALIPEIIYFINANGLSVVVQNFATMLVAIVNAVIESGIIPVTTFGEFADYLTENGDGTNAEGEPYNGTYSIDLDAIMTNLLKSALSDYVDDSFTFSFAEVNLHYVISLVEQFTGLNIEDVVGYTFEKFIIGRVERYDSASTVYVDETTGKTNTYKVVFADPYIAGTTTLDQNRIGQTRADMITILLSLVIDLLGNSGNQNAIANLVNNATGEQTISASTIAAIVDMLQSEKNINEMQLIDWLYFSDATSYYDRNGNLKPVAPDLTGASYIAPARTINYIEYYSDWTKEDADYVMDNLDEIIEEVLGLVDFEGVDTVRDVINGNFTLNDLYSPETLESVVGMITDLTSGYGAIILNLLGILLDSDFSGYNGLEAINNNVTDKASFARALTTVIQPLYPLLNWLFFGEDLIYFYDNDYYNSLAANGGDATSVEGPEARDLINLPGAEGYKYGIVPLLEALGVEDLPYCGAMDKLTANTANVTQDFMYKVIIAVLTRVEEILADPIDEVIALLPNLIYFINAGGVTASIHNTLAAVEGMIPAVCDLLEGFGVTVISDLELEEINVNTIVNGLIKTLDIFKDSDVTVNTDHLDLLGIVGIIEALTGLQIEGAIEHDHIRYFYFGQLEVFSSSNGKTGFRMVYSDKEGEPEMLTLLINFILEVALDENNTDKLAELLGISGDTLEAILYMISGDLPVAAYKTMNWNYFDGTLRIPAVSGAERTYIEVPTDRYIYLEYANAWTLQKANDLDAAIPELVDGILQLVMNEDDTFSLSRLIAGYYDEYAGEYVFNASNLNLILGYLDQYLYGEDAYIGEYLLNLAMLILGGELTGYEGNYSFEDYDSAKTYTTDATYSLKYRLEDGKRVYAVETEQDFINGLYMMLKPASGLLAWLFLGKNYNFFVYDEQTYPGGSYLISIPGTDGYGQSLSILLEALGVELTKTSAQYNGDGAAMLKDVLTALVARIHEIIENPVDELLDLIPELIYFINAGGLGVVVNNLATSLMAIVNYAYDAFELDLLDEAYISNGDFDVIEYVENYLSALVSDLSGKNVTISLDEINTGWAIDLIEQLTDFRIHEVIDDEVSVYAVEKFVLGTPTKYDTKSSFSEAYRIVLDPTNKYTARSNMITIILSLAIELLENAHNQAIVEDLAGLTSGTLADVVTLIKAHSIEIEPNFDWAYFDPDYVAGETLTLPERSINYLTYYSDWTEGFATYLDSHLNTIIEAILDKIPETEGQTVKDIIAGVFSVDETLYQADVVNNLVDTIKGFAGNLDSVVSDAIGSEANNNVLSRAVNLLFDIDLHAWDSMSFTQEQVSDAAGFAAAVREIIAPLTDILNWLLFGSDFQIFNRKHVDSGVIDNIIDINGYNGFYTGLVPLLEALGVDLSDLKDNDPIPTKIEIAVRQTLLRLEQILENPVDEVLELLPNLIYFINANGLAASVKHTLGSVLSMVDAVNALLEDFSVEFNISGNNYNRIDIDTMLTDIVNGLLNKTGDDRVVINTDKLDLVGIAELIEGATGIELVDVVTEEKMDMFFFGQLEPYDSANGTEMVKMVYSEDEARHDMITVLFNYVVEVVLYSDNQNVIEDLVGLERGSIQSILDALGNLGGAELPFDWNYFWGIEGEPHSGDAGYEMVTDRYVTPETPFGNYLSYKSDWTKSLANDLYNNLDTIINSVLAMTGSEYQTVSDIINNSFTLYKGEYLNSILDLLKKLYDVLDNDVFLGVLDELLDLDLTYWRTLPAYSTTKTYTSNEWVAAIVEMVRPVYTLIDWLFFGKDMTLFVDSAHGGPANGGTNLIVVSSVDAYADGLVPILEALGVELPEYDGTQKSSTKVIVNGVRMDYFQVILNAILDRVNAILADPVNEALELLPELLYFINTNGLSTAVYNMLGGIINAVNVVIDKGIIDIGAASIEDYVANSFGINLRKLDLVGLFEFVEGLDAVHGLKLNDVFTRDFNGDGITENILEYFYIGEYANSYRSTASLKDGSKFKGYKMTLDEENKGDLLTMLLSVVLEVLLYDENEAAVTAIIQNFKSDFTQENFHTLKLLLASGIGDAEMEPINWVYFWNYSDEVLQTKIEDALNDRTTQWPSEPVLRTQNALQYSNNWNTDVRDYLNLYLDEIVDLAIAKFTDASSLSDLLYNKLDLWSSKDVNPDSIDLANLLLGYIKNALSRIDDVLVDTVGSLLGAGQLSALKNAEARGLESKEDFIDFMVTTLTPLSKVLDFVLFGADYKFFTHLSDGDPWTIILNGGEGYKYGLAPILAALGVNTEISVERSDVALREVFTNLVNRIDDILYGGNTINEALELILNVIYFINADGISTSVMNLLAPIDELLNVVNDEIHFRSEEDLSVNDFITAVDLENLNLDFIFDLVEDKTGIDVETPIGDYLKGFYFGATEYFNSYGNLGNFRMVYSENENRIDFITVVVTLLLDVVVYEGNHDKLVEIVANAMNVDNDTANNDVNAIIALLTNNEISIEMARYEWEFLTYADTGTVISASNGLSGDSIFGTGIYGPLYTREMGEYISKFLPLCIDTYLVLLGVDNGHGGTYRSLEEILSELIGNNIYTNEILQKIAGAITGAVANLKETIGDRLFNHIVNVLNASLGVDLNDLLYGRVATITEGNQQQFIKALCDLLAPVAPILRWLLSDNYDIALFNHDTVVNPGDTYAAGDDYLVLHGADGYQNAIIPILEALCVGTNDNILTQAEFDAIEDNSELISTVLTPIFERINTILDDPINEILKELPAVVYFLNSYGLDTAVRNLLNPIYSLLETIEPLIHDVDALHNSRGEVDLLALANIDLSEMTANSLIDMAIGMISDSISGFDLTGMIGDAVTELTMGTVDSFESVRIMPEYQRGEAYRSDPSKTRQTTASGNAIDYTMHYGSEGSGGDQVDYVTIILRLILKFISVKQNVIALEALLKDKLNDNGYKFACSLLENFSQMASTDDGMDKIMYTFYYIFYAALNAGVATNNGLANFNGNYSFLNQLFATSNVGFLRQLEQSLGDLLNNYGTGVINDHEVIPDGQISFWQKIINFFKKLLNMIKGLFGG